MWGYHNMLTFAAFREQIFDEVALSCTEVAVRRDGKPTTLRTRVWWDCQGYFCVIVFVFLQVSRRDFDGFKKLFHRFLQVKGPSVDWAKISRPPEEAVSSRRTPCLPLAPGIESLCRDLRKASGVTMPCCSPRVHRGAPRPEHDQANRKPLRYGGVARATARGVSCDRKLMLVERWSWSD